MNFILCHFGRTIFSLCVDTHLFKDGHKERGIY
jgi:hypothetical protein